MKFVLSSLLFFLSISFVSFGCEDFDHGYKKEVSKIEVLHAVLKDISKAEKSVEFKSFLSKRESKKAKRAIVKLSGFNTASNHFKTIDPIKVSKRFKSNQVRFTHLNYYSYLRYIRS